MIRYVSSVGEWSFIGRILDSWPSQAKPESTAACIAQRSQCRVFPRYTDFASERPAVCEGRHPAAAGGCHRERCAREALFPRAKPDRADPCGARSETERHCAHGYFSRDCSLRCRPVRGTYRCSLVRASPLGHSRRSGAVGPACARCHNSGLAAGRLIRRMVPRAPCRGHSAQ